MKNLELEGFGCSNLVESENYQINGGGGIGSLFQKLTLGGIAYYVIENWSDIKSGAVSAWNDYDKK